MDKYTIIHGNSLDKLKELQDNSVDSVVTDPPYELGFMGKKWDNTGIANNFELWKQVYRVLKPGGHMLAFSGTRTYHRMVCAIEDAGFEIRDQLAWIYGSGFPKSQNIGKMIAKKENKLKNTKTYMPDITSKGNVKNQQCGSPRCQMCDKSTGPIWKKCPDNRSDCIKPWEEDKQDNDYNGWGTALKPAQEPIVLARKPLSETTVAKNVIKHGTGAINIDDSRVATTDKFGGGAKGSSGFAQGYTDEGWVAGSEKGRWPANVIHDGSDEVVSLFPETKGGTWNRTDGARHFNNNGKNTGHSTTKKDNTIGGAARFFYSPKANKKDRNEGCEKLPTTKTNKSIGNRRCLSCGRLELDRITSRCKCDNPDWSNETLAKSIHNNHPTVKPTELMRYLIRLITPKGGIVLDPFMGSGSTGKAAMLLGNKFIGIDMTAEYIPIAEARIKHAMEQYETENSKNQFFTEEKE